MAGRSRQEKKSKGKAQNKAGDKVKLSAEEKAAAESIVNDVSKAGFNKQQRKEVQSAIEQGIERYKRQHKSKARDYDKALKKQRKQVEADQSQEVESGEGSLALSVILPWALLLLSWAVFTAFIALK